MASTKPQLERFLIENVRAHPADITARAMAEFGLSREWVSRTLNRLVKAGVLTKSGRTKGVRYVLTEERHEQLYSVTPGLAEHEIWNQFAAPRLMDLADNVRSICHYGFTEMVNNVLDHSESTEFVLIVERAADQVTLTVWDAGIGIFRKIQASSGLDSLRDAVFELSKGKFTTDASRHSGEGVFFTSRVFDQFGILSSNLYFAHDRDSDDWLLETRERENDRGTCVTMSISPMSTHTVQEVFDHYSAEQDDFGFSKTCLVLRLAQQADGPLVSRSQAKRILARLFRFKEVFFDFAGVDEIGPAFADEIFRVFRAAHPEIRLMTTNVGEQPHRMIERAEAAAREALAGKPTNEV